MRPALAAILLLAAPPAAAHRGHASLAVVEIDARSGAMRVTHSMAAHDVEPALVDIAPDAQPSLDDPDALQALITYVGQRFRIRGVTLSPAGQRLDGDAVQLHYIGRLKGKPRQLLIAGALFGETWPDHATQVNVRRIGNGGGNGAAITRTLMFRPGDPEKPISLGSD